MKRGAKKVLSFMLPIITWDWQDPKFNLDVLSNHTRYNSQFQVLNRENHAVEVGIFLFLRSVLVVVQTSAKKWRFTC
jgi:hypothetical protein